MHVPYDESRILGFGENVRGERLDGSPLGMGWGIFHRWHLIEVDEPDDWHGYVELTLDPAINTADRLALPFDQVFRVVPLPKHGHLPTIVVSCEMTKRFADKRVGLLVWEWDDSSPEPSGRWPDYQT